MLQQFSATTLYYDLVNSNFNQEFRKQMIPLGFTFSIEAQHESHPTVVTNLPAKLSNYDNITHVSRNLNLVRNNRKI